MDVDTSGLCDEFDLNQTKIEIKSFREILSEVNHIENPTQLLTAIIDQCTIFLDLVQQECLNGAMSARYAEVAATLINTLVQTANSIAGVENIKFNQKISKISMKQKDKALELKDKELEIKKLYYQNKNQIENKGGTQQNIVVTDRETILKFLDKDKT